MKPIEFAEQNKILTKPEGMTDKQCRSLPCWANGEQIISRWKMSWRERLIAFLTGKIWVSVWSGHTSPPIKPMIETPFEKATKWQIPLRFKDLGNKMRRKA